MTTSRALGNGAAAGTAGPSSAVLLAVAFVVALAMAGTAAFLVAEARDPVDPERTALVINPVF